MLPTYRDTHVFLHSCIASYFGQLYWDTWEETRACHSHADHTMMTIRYLPVEGMIELNSALREPVFLLAPAVKS